MTTRQDTRTVIGVFDDYSSAERAARNLADAGIPREAIDVQSHLKIGAAGASGHTTERTRPRP